MNRKLVLGTLLILSLGVIGFLISSSLTSAQKLRQVDATRVVPGPSTPEEKAFSKVIAEMYPNREKKI